MATLTLFHVLVFSMLGLLRSQVPYIWTTPPLDISMDHSLTSFKPRCHYLLISEVFLITLLWGKLSVQFSLVAQSCLTLCNPMDCSTPGFPVHHELLELTQTHVHWVTDAIQPSHPLSSPSPALNLSQHHGLFQWVSTSHQVAKVLDLIFNISPSNE